jgi:hypothetical protein
MVSRRGDGVKGSKRWEKEAIGWKRRGGPPDQCLFSARSVVIAGYEALGAGGD